MFKRTFKQFLDEMDAPSPDVEDLSAEELKKRAQELLRTSQLKAAGRDEQVNKNSLRELQVQLRAATDPRQKADLQRRIKELMTPVPQTGM